jgi:glycosyltransferase involved in cell wall biosynthesis
VHRPGSEQTLAGSSKALIAADALRFVAAVAGYLAAAFRLRRHTFDFAYERYGLYQGLGSAAARRGVPWVLEVNALLAEEATSSRPATRSKRLAEAAEAWAFRRCDAIVAVSDALKSEIVGRYGIGSSKVLVIPNGVEVERFHHERAVPRLGAPITIGFVGALYSWQRVDALVQAVAAIGPSVRLLVAGEGQESSSLRRLIKERGLGGQVELLGRLAPDDVPALLARCDLTYAGHDAEGGAYFSPLKLWEYLAAGCPVVASRHSQTEELERAGFAVRCFDASSADDLTRVLNSAVREIDDLRQLATQGVARVRELHSWQSRMKTLIEGLRERRLLR